MSVGHEASDVHKQAVRGDAARHEVMIQVTEDIQLLRGDLFPHKDVHCEDVEQVTVTSTLSFHQ